MGAFDPHFDNVICRIMTGWVEYERRRSFTARTDTMVMIVMAVLHANWLGRAGKSQWEALYILTMGTLSCVLIGWELMSTEVITVFSSVHWLRRAENDQSLRLL